MFVCLKPKSQPQPCQRSMLSREAHPRLFVSMKVVSDDMTQKEVEESESCRYWEQDKNLDLGT